MSIRPRSRKRAADERRYTVRRRTFLAGGRRCELGPALDAARAGRAVGHELPLTGPEAQAAHVAAARCAVWASEVHHLAGRDGDRLLNEDLWAAACRPCHAYVTANPRIAYATGTAVRRHAHQPQEDPQP